MYTIQFDAAALERKLGEIERTAMPGALVKAANATAFQVRDRWKTRIAEVFERPTPFTRNAALYKTATLAKLTAEIFIRDEASKGTPPAKYLFPEEVGGPRRQKAFERKLQGNPRVRNAFFVPGRSRPRDQHGNLPLNVYNKIFAQLQVAEDRAGFSANETAAGRKRRLRKQRIKGGGGSFFILPTNRGKLRAGVVYERIGNGQASIVRASLFPVSQAPTYSKRFEAIAIARDIANSRFPKNFNFFLKDALLKAGYPVF